MARYCLVAAVLLLTWSAVCGKPLEIKAQIKEIDVKKGTITLLEGPPKFQVEHTYSLARPDLPVALPTGKTGKVGDLKEGFKVGVQLLGEDVTAIRIIPSTLLVASFARFDGKARTVAVRLAGSLTDSVFMLQEDASLQIDNKDAAWGDLKPGQKVQLVFVGDRNVVQVQAGADIAAAKETRAKLIRMYGILLDHDPVQHKARIIHSALSNVQMKEYAVAADAEVKLFHAKEVLRVIPFKDLGPLLRVHFFLDWDTNTIVAIDAEQPVLPRRKIVALDVEKRKITIEDEKKNRTYDLAPAVKVIVAGKPETLERVKGAAWANLGLSLDRTQVEVLFLTKADLNKAK